jgi:ribonuclease P protein component
VIGRIPRRVGFAPFRTSRAVREASLSLRVALDPAAGSVRVAFSTPKRIGSAVERNRIRRRLRELMRARAERLPHGWYLVQVDVGSVDKDWGQLGTMLDRVLDRALREPAKAMAPTTHRDSSIV